MPTDLTEIAQLIDAGKIKPIVTEVLPLSDAVKAQQQAATHHTRGKVVLRIADEPKTIRLRILLTEQLLLISPADAEQSAPWRTFWSIAR